MGLAIALFFLFDGKSLFRPDEPPDAELSESVNTPVPSAPPTPAPTPPELVDVPAEPSNPALLSSPGERTPSFELLEAGYTSYDSRVEMIEINQVLSYGFDVETAEFYVMTNFVAGKDTGIFISFSEPVAESVYLTSYLTVERDGHMLGYMLPYAVPDDYTLLYHPRNMSNAENWTQGGYTFRLYIDEVEAAVRTANFFDTMCVKVLAVPIRANYSGRISACTGDWRNSAEWLLAAFPVARANVEYILGPELDLSGQAYNLDTSAGLFNVWKAVSDLQTPGNDYTLIVGFIRDSAFNEQYLGYTYGLPASIVVEDCASMAAVVPHEVAHCYSIGDEYEGGHLNTALNTPPYNMRGVDIFTNRPAVGRNPNVIGAWSMGINGTGSVIYENQRAYWAAERKLLGPVSSYMSGVTGAGNETFWTSSDIYNHLFKVFSGYFGGYVRPTFWGVCPSCFGDVYDPDFYCECVRCGSFTKRGEDLENFICESCADEEPITWDCYYLDCGVCDQLIHYEWFYRYNTSNNNTTQASEAQNVNVIEITGFLGADGSFRPTPWYTYDLAAPEIAVKTDGEYAVCFFGADGRQISINYFNAEFLMQVNTAEGQSFLPAGEAYINVAARFPENAARIVILKGDREIYSVNVSSATPQVSFSGLSDAQNLGNNVTLNWTASGSADELFFEIWYCPSEGGLYNVASNVTGRSFEADLSQFPGSDNGYFQIFATDGVVTGESISPMIRIPYKAPIIITETDGIQEYRLTQEITLDVDVYDLQDGWLGADGGSVTWMFNGREYLNYSYLWVFPYELEPGLHTFTCIATNTAGMSSRKDFTFRVLDDESDLPDDWSRGEIASALSRGFVLTLDRLDAPITRGEYAELMTNFFYICLSPNVDDPFRAYEEGFITDCGWNDWKQFIMVHLGLMDAPDGRFNPGGSLTEREAAMIMYKVVALADPRVSSADDPESSIIQTFERLGFFDPSGPNAYNSSEKLTCKLALVRLWRFYDALFN